MQMASIQTTETLRIMEVAAYQAAADAWGFVLNAMRQRDMFPLSSAAWLDHDEQVRPLITEAKKATELAEAITAEIRATTPAPITHVPMACTTCGKPVRETEPGSWQHVTRNDNCQVVRLGGIIRARVDA